MIRCVLLDAVGTLLIPDPPVAEAYFAAGRRFGSRLTPVEIGPRFRAAWLGAFGQRRSAADQPSGEVAERACWRQVVADVFHDVSDVDAGLFPALWDHFAQPAHWRLFDDVPPLLGELDRRGLPWGIASNFDSRLLAIGRGHTPLAGCPRWFLSSQLGWSKPDGRFFAAAARDLGLPPAEILLVGDDEENDVAGARSAGWQAALLCRDLTSPCPPGALRSLAQVPALLDGP